MQKESKLYFGDCLDVMPQFETDSIDAIVTDPPYGISFMQRKWDVSVPSVNIWEECLRVLKPGAFAFVMSSPRQDVLSRMICRLEDAGFNIGFSSIYWTYATGFLKAQNLSKVADKRAGVEREIIGKAKYADKRRVTKDTSISLGTSSNSYISIPATPQAKALEGAYSGFRPKPAVEVVIVAMKPINEKTYLDQAISNKHGCTWLDNCKIPYENDNDIASRHKNNTFKLKSNDERGHTQMDGWDLNEEKREVACYNNNGRFPANVLCEDDILNDGIIRKSCAVLTHHKRSGNSNLGETFKIRDRTGEYADWKSNSGEYSRFFSLDAWFEERIKLLPKEAQKTFPWLIVPKATKSEKNRRLFKLEDTVKGYGENEYGMNANNFRPDGSKRKAVIMKNSHATVKPIKLMSWLITLASREGDIVLDPFCGSGTTLIAAKMLSRQYIGIELEKEYYDIARLRIDEAQKNMDSFL